MRKINIQGKDYVPVHERLMEFWKTNSSWSIWTEILESPQGMIRFRASIFDEHGILRATGHAEEQQDSTFINKTSYVENCETSAIGRALGLLGIGIDTSLASFEEMANAMAQQDVQQEKPKQFYDDDREWLSQVQFEKTIERYNGGEKDVIDKVIKTFKMKRELREQLLKLKGVNNHG
jgi:hypothetical protein